MSPVKTATLRGHMWTARRIFKELVDADRRKKILSDFWRYAEPNSKAVATAQLARALHFRDETLRKLPVEKKAELLGSRIGAAEFEEHLELALMQYHTHEANEMMAAFLDRWGVPHVNGSIEAEDYTAPTAEQVRDAVRELSGTYDKRDIALYLASAGLLMTEQWRDATWPVVDELASESGSTAPQSKALRT
jgi:hypothetical protein